jgi:retron-type reverse transcriptase
LKEHINDQQFIDLYWKFVRAGYMEFGMMRPRSVGVQQGSIISPILSNIYLDKFDKYVEHIKDELEANNKGKHSNVYPESAKLDNTIHNRNKSQVLATKKRYKRLGKV